MSAYLNFANAAVEATAALKDENAALKTGLRDCVTRMERARSILKKDGEGWMMLETTAARKLLGGKS